MSDDIKFCCTMCGWSTTDENEVHSCYTTHQHDLEEEDENIN